jgi:hypothetical protein
LPNFSNSFLNFGPFLILFLFNAQLFIQPSFTDHEFKKVETMHLCNNCGDRITPGFYPGTQLLLAIETESAVCTTRFVPVCQTRSLNTSGWVTAFRWMRRDHWAGDLQVTSPRW